MKHTKGRLGLVGPASISTIDRKTVLFVPVRLKDSERTFPRADAVRLISCWNAMEGIEDPAAARIILDLPQTQYANEMLQMLRHLALFNGLERLDPDHFKKMKALIAKASR